MTDEARKALADIAAKLDEYSRTHGLISTDFDREQFAKMATALRSQPGTVAREEVARIVTSAKYVNPDAQDQLDWNAACEHIEGEHSADRDLAERQIPQTFQDELCELRRKLAVTPPEQNK